MSHFTTIVIGDDVDEQLKPYQEGGTTWFQTKDGNEAKWDWYVIGGRWLGYFKLKKGRDGQLGEAGAFDNKRKFDADVARKGDIDFRSFRTPFAVVKDGKWYERGQVGWWGVVVNEKAEKKWRQQVKKLLADVPDDTLLTVVDCHI